MSAQSAKKKRLGSRRRAGNQNEMSKTDDSHGTGTTFVAELHVPEENTDSLNLLANFDNSHSETYHPTSPELLGNRRKLGSRRRNKEQHVKDSVTESYHEPREEVDRTTSRLAIQPEKQADVSPNYSSEAQNVTTTNCSEADLESFSSNSENLHADREENETDSKVISESLKFVKTMQEGIDISDLYNEEVKESAHLVGISALTSLSVLSCPIVDQQLIDQSNYKEKLPNVCFVTENEGKERDYDTEMFFPTTPDETTENTKMECSVQQGTISSPKEELPEISGNLINQTEVCETNQFGLIVKNICDSPTNQDIAISDSIQDVNAEALEWRNEDYHVYDSKEPQISDIDRVDTALSQVFEMEGSVERETKPSAEQTGQQEQEGLLSETEESAPSLQTLQSEINASFDSQPQQNDTSFNSIGNRRKLGSSRRIKGRQHVKDSVAESDHEPTEDVVGSISDNETLETTEMTVIVETAMPEKSMESLLKETDKFDTAQTEEVSDQVQENAQDGTLVGIANLNSSGLESRSTDYRQTIEQSNFGEMPDEEVPKVCSLTKKENKDNDEYTDWFRQDGNIQSKYVVSQDVESSITPEITTEKLSREHTEPECSIEQDVCSTPKEELHANEGQNKIFNLPKVKGDYHSEVSVNKPHEQDVEPTENQEMSPLDYSSESVTDRQHVKDSVAESDHEPAEDVVGNIGDNETTDMTLVVETAVQKKSMESLLEETDKFDTAQTEEVTDQVKENAQGGTLIGIANLNISGLQSSTTDDQQTIKQSHLREMPDEEVPNVCFESKEPQLSVTERVDTALSQVFEMEGRVERETKPSAEQTGQQKQEGLLSEKEESAPCLQDRQSEINAPFDSQPQQNNNSFNSTGSRRKLGSSRRNKGRQHVKDSVVELDHGHKEEDAEITRGNEAFATVQMSLPTERTSHEELSQERENDIMPVTHDSSLYSAITSGYSSEVQSPTLKHYPEAALDSLIPKSKNLQEDYNERENDFKAEVSDKSVEATLEETDKLDTAKTEDVTNRVKKNAQDVTLVGIANLNSSGLESTVDQQKIKLSNFREMPDEEFPNVCSQTENEERNEDTHGFRQDENVQGNYLVTESHVKSEDFSFTLEINTEKSVMKERNEIECDVEQADFSSSEEKLPTNEEQAEHVDLSQVRGTWHSQEAVHKVHQEEIKPTQMQERHQMDNTSIKDTESNLQRLPLERIAPLDSQPLDNSQNITGFNSTGNMTKLGSSQRNGHLHVKDATEMALVMKTMTQEETKEQTDLDSKSAREMRSNTSSVNNKEDTEIMSEDDTNILQNVMGNNTIGRTDITFSSSKDDSVETIKEVTEEEDHLIKEIENLGQLTGRDTVKMDLIQSPEVLVWKEDSDIQSSSYQDDVAARSNTSDEAFQVQNTEASNVDKTTILQQTNDTSETVGNVTIKDCQTGVEGTMYAHDYEQDEDGAQFQDPTKKENEAQEINVSKEMFSAPHNKIDATVDIGLNENLRAEPAVDVSEESGISSQQGIQEKNNLNDSDLPGRSKQKRRKMGSTRRTQLNRKPEEERVENKKSDNEEVDMRNLDKMEVVEELTMIATAEVTQNENAKPSLSLVCKETNETSTVDGMKQQLQSSDLQSNMMSDKDYSKALPPEQSGSHNEDVVDPVKFVHEADVEPSQIDEVHISSVFAGRNTNTGISGFVSLCETTLSSQNDEVRPESVNIIQDQALKSTEALLLADLEIVKSVDKGGAGEEHITAESNDANEGAHQKNPEMKNASSYLDTSSRRRKMGSTRRSLRSGTKQEDLHQTQDVSDEATETATNVGDVTTESFPRIIKDELQLDGKHKDAGSETIDYSHSGEVHKPLSHQTFEEMQLLETEHQLTPSDLPVMPSTSPKHDLISESASGGRRRKMGSHRKSHGHQNYENQTALRDRITDTPNERDVRSIGEESAIKTEEMKEERLGLDKIPKVDESYKKPFSKLSTSKEGEHPRPASEKTPESVTPVQHHYAEHQQKLSLASRADLRSNAYNVMMVGDSSVGKTSFMKRAQSGKFSLDIPASIGLDSCMWTVVVEGKPVVLKLWDTAGQERFHSLTRQIFHKADAFLLMYDVTSSQSFSAVSYWASCIQEGAAESVTILLVGNKSDRVEQQVQTQEAENLAKENNFEFMECSAATGENVIQCLETVARMLSQKVDPRDETTVLHKEHQPKTSRCC